MSLAELGLRVQLGHIPGIKCAHPHPAPINFAIIHTNSIHSVSVDYCECDNANAAGSHRQQLLRRGWFPATHTEPKCCSSFIALEQFHMLNLQGKIAGYDYFSGLEKLTDNAGLIKIRVSLFTVSLLNSYSYSSIS